MVRAFWRRLDRHVRAAEDIELPVRRTDDPSSKVPNGQIYRVAR